MTGMPELLAMTTRQGLAADASIGRYTDRSDSERDNRASGCDIQRDRLATHLTARGLRLERASAALRSPIGGL